MNIFITKDSNGENQIEKQEPLIHNCERRKQKQGNVSSISK